MCKQPVVASISELLPACCIDCKYTEKSSEIDVTALRMVLFFNLQSVIMYV